MSSLLWPALVAVTGSFFAFAFIAGIAWGLLTCLFPQDRYESAILIASCTVASISLLAFALRHVIL